MSYVVSSEDTGKFGLGKLEGVNEVLRNIAVILATPLGSVPLYRDFGIDWSFLDKPESEAENWLTTPESEAENWLTTPVREAIERWEPRAEFVRLILSRDPSNPGRVIPKVEVEINLE